MVVAPHGDATISLLLLFRRPSLRQEHRSRTKPHPTSLRTTDHRSLCKGIPKLHYRLRLQAPHRHHRKFGLQGFEIRRDGIGHINGSSFIFRGLHDNLQSIKSIEGVDVCWVEEAQTISKTSLTTLIPTIRKTNSTLIFTWNPLTSHDPIWAYFVSTDSEERLHQTCHWHTTFNDVRRLLSQDVLDMVEADKQTADYGHVWLGLPYADANNQLISDAMINEALQRAATDGPVTFGVDVARYGNDRTALAIKKATASKHSNHGPTRVSSTRPKESDSAQHNTSQSTSASTTPA